MSMDINDKLLEVPVEGCMLEDQNYDHLGWGRKLSFGKRLGVTPGSRCL